MVERDSEVVPKELEASILQTTKTSGTVACLVLLFPFLFWSGKRRGKEKKKKKKREVDC